MDRINGFHPTEVKNLIVKNQFGVSAPVAAEAPVKEVRTRDTGAENLPAFAAWMYADSNRFRT